MTGADSCGVVAMATHPPIPRTAHSVSENDTPHTSPLLRKGRSVGYLLVILSHTRNIFKWGGRYGA